VTGQPRTIVVVDASPDTLELLEAYFGGLGYQVVSCPMAETETNEELLARLCASDPDVIIYDIDMPYASSWRAALTVCFDTRVRCPFVFTTTNVRIAKQLMSGVTRADVIAKPYLLQVLHAAVTNALAGYRRTPQEDGERRQGDRRRGDRRRG
jgi:CheY-like chemotaxis protein